MLHAFEVRRFALYYYSIFNRETHRNVNSHLLKNGLPSIRDYHITPV
jgi:hypothetical protein